MIREIAGGISPDEKFIPMPLRAKKKGDLF